MTRWSAFCQPPNSYTTSWDSTELEADHRRHAEIENAIRDLKYGVGLNHLPSGRFPANAAWLAVQLDFVQKLDTWRNRRTSCCGWPTEILHCRG